MTPDSHDSTVTQQWRRLGRIFVAQGENSWMQSHAYLPTALLLTAARIRIFLAFLDATQRGRIGFVDVSADDPTKILQVSSVPCLDLGAKGRFDEDGVSPLSIVAEGDRLFLFYAGWQRVESVRYLLFTGLAISVDGGNSFRRFSQVPVLDRTEEAAIVRTGAFVFRADEEWLCFYLAGSEQILSQGKMVPTYSLWVLKSQDPTRWTGRGKLVLAPKFSTEFGFSRPWILRKADLWKMWWAIRIVDRGYRIGYAESVDGEEWSRHDSRFQFVGPVGQWELNETSFPSVVDTRSGCYMFYNGDDFGGTGFGVARLMSQ